MTAMKAFLPFALLAILASCSATAPDPFLTTQAITPEAPPIATDVAPEFAAAYLPSLAGGIQAVRQTISKDHLRQEIVYQNQTALAGENVLTIEVGPPADGAFLRPPTEAKVRAEMRAAFPGKSLAISPVIADNVGGPYGYATITEGTGACLYAWQHVKSITPADSDGFDKFTRNHLSASIRLRYCHPAITADRIHLLMDGLKVKELNSRTIDVLRFAAGSARVDMPVAVLTPEPVKQKRNLVRKAEVTEPEEDWRPKDKPVAQIDDLAAPAVIDNAAAVPLPETIAGDSSDPLVTKAADIVEPPIRKIDNAAEVPLPE